MQSCSLYHNFSINHSLTSRYKLRFLVLIQSFLEMTHHLFSVCLSFSSATPSKYVGLKMKFFQFHRKDRRTFSTNSIDVQSTSTSIHVQSISNVSDQPHSFDDFNHKRKAQSTNLFLKVSHLFKIKSLIRNYATVI
jgi:hypothetical protein